MRTWGEGGTAGAKPGPAGPGRMIDDCMRAGGDSWAHHWAHGCRRPVRRFDAISGCSAVSRTTLRSRGISSNSRGPGIPVGHTTHARYVWSEYTIGRRARVRVCVRACAERNVHTTGALYVGLLLAAAISLIASADALQMRRGRAAEYEDGRTPRGLGRTRQDHASRGGRTREC